MHDSSTCRSPRLDSSVAAAPVLCKDELRRLKKFRDFRSKGHVAAENYLVERTDLLVQMF